MKKVTKKAERREWKKERKRSGKKREWKKLQKEEEREKKNKTNHGRNGEGKWIKRGRLNFLGWREQNTINEMNGLMKIIIHEKTSLERKEV